MNVLWFAFGFYILGISVVLWTRPSLMFDGEAWKEFGLSRKGNATIFPFWMFVIVWAFVSYILGTLCVIGCTGVAATVAATVTAAEPTPKEAPLAGAGLEAPLEAPLAGAGLEAPKELDFIKTPPVRRKPRRAKGYYVRGMVKGKPTYVYYGKESPFDEDA